MLRRACSSRSSVRICAWVVTSSAVVGSSAISSAGSLDQRHGDHHALALAAGELVRDRRRPGSRASAGARPRGGFAPARAGPGGRALRNARPASPRSDRRRSCTGFSAVIGSWNTIAIRLPRSRRRRAAPTVSTSSPSSRIRPEDGVRIFGSRPITAAAVTDLPEPDSPTTQTISPGCTVRLRSWIAKARSPPPGSRTERFRTSRTGGAHRPFPKLRAVRGSSASRRPSPIMLTASTVGPGTGPETGSPRARSERRSALGHDVAPARNLGGDAGAEEAQDRLGEDRGGRDVGPCTISGATVLGRTCRTSSFGSRVPAPIAAST